MKNESLSSIRYSSNFYGKRFLIILLFMIIFMIADISLVRIYDLTSKQFISVEAKNVLFYVISIGCLSTQYLLLEIVKPSKDKDKSRTRLNTLLLYKSTKAILYVLGAIVIYIILQIQFNSYYSTYALLILIIISYSICLEILGIFITRVFRLISFNRKSVITTLFALTLISLALNSAIAMIDTSLRLEYRPDETMLFLGGSVDVSKGKFDILDNLYFGSFLFSFIAAWVFMAVLLRYYSNKLGKIKYSLIVSAPLLFFLGQFFSLLASTISSVVNMDVFFRYSLITLIITLSKPIGGLMLAISFWTMGKVGESNSPLRKHLFTSGFGILLLFTSNQALLLAITPYPPFGASTVTVIGFAAYLTVVGIYAPVILISQDAELRKSIRRIASSQLLHSMAFAEMEREIENRVSELVKIESVKMENETGLSPSLTPDEAKQYLEDVLKELKKK